MLTFAVIVFDLLYIDFFFNDEYQFKLLAGWKYSFSHKY